MYLIIAGPFFVEGVPYCIANTREQAVIWLRQQGWHKCPDRDCYEKRSNETGWFARIIEIEHVVNFVGYI